MFPQASFVLFEANADNAVHLAGGHLSGHRHFTVALSAQDGEKPLFLPRAGDATGTSLYRENSAHYDAGNLVVRTVATARLDTLVAAEKLPPANLIKIDVQGAELDVIAGAKTCALALRDADHRALTRGLQQGCAADRGDPAGDHAARFPLR